MQLEKPASDSDSAIRGIGNGWAQQSGKRIAAEKADHMNEAGEDRRELQPSGKFRFLLYHRAEV
jgi:hypothetical protein